MRWCDLNDNTSNTVQNHAMLTVRPDRVLFTQDHRCLQPGHAECVRVG